MRSTIQSSLKRGFTLIEILIVVVILGILAAIVIPQFTNASEEAAESSAQSQLQTVRSQIELWRIQHPGIALPDYADAGVQWDTLTDQDPVTGQRYLQQAPRNAMMNNSTLCADAAGAGVAWVWDAAEEQLWAVMPDPTDPTAFLVAPF